MAGSQLIGRANQLAQIANKKFGIGSITYSKHGYAGNPTYSAQGYRDGHAIDIYPIGKVGEMAVGEDRKKGDAIAAFVEKNWQAFGVKNIIWWKRINTGSGWKDYDPGGYGRGSSDWETQLHGDHVHVQLSNVGLIGEYED